MTNPPTSGYLLKSLIQLPLRSLPNSRSSTPPPTQERSRTRLVPPPLTIHKHPLPQQSESESQSPAGNDHSDLGEALRASNRQRELEEALATREQDELARALSLSTITSSEPEPSPILAPSNGFVPRSCLPSPLPPGAAYPPEKDHNAQDAMLALAIQLSIQERDHWYMRGSEAEVMNAQRYHERTTGRETGAEEMIAQLAPAPLPSAARRRRPVPPRPCINTSKFPPPLPPRSAQTPTQLSFEALTPTANSLPTQDTYATPTRTRPITIPDLPLLGYNPVSNNDANGSPPYQVYFSNSLPPSPVTSMSSDTISSDSDDEDEQWLRTPYHPLNSIASTLSAQEPTNPICSLPSETACSYFPPIGSITFRANGGLVNPHLLTPRPQGYEGPLSTSASFVTALETSLKEERYPDSSLGDTYGDELSTEEIGLTGPSLSFSEIQHAHDALTPTGRSLSFTGKDHPQPKAFAGTSQCVSETENSQSLIPIHTQQLVPSGSKTDPTKLVSHDTPMTTTRLEETQTSRPISVEPFPLGAVEDPDLLIGVVEEPALEAEASDGPETEPAEYLAKFGFVGPEGELSEEQMTETVRLSGRQEFGIESQSWADLLHWLMWWGETQLESSKGGRGMVRLVVEFKGSTGNTGEEGSVRLNIKLVRPDDEPKPEEQQNPKGKRREDLFGTRRHVIPDGVLVPCRFAGLAVTLFTLGQLAGIACSTAAGTDATNAYRGLRRLGQSIAMLETEGRDERRKKARTSGLVDRLRERLRRLKRPDEIWRRASRRGVPLERVERSAADLVRAGDGLRWLPILGS